MSNHDKWMPLYIGDYMGDTMHLSTLQHGAYMLLLMHYWRNGPLPDDDRKLAQIARTEDRAWQSIGPVIREFFSVNGDGTLHQKRMDWERRRWGEISAKRSDAGKRGVEAKRRSRPNEGGGQPAPPQPQPKVVQAYIIPQPAVGKPEANAKQLLEPTPVDNLANAKQTPSKPEANAGAIAKQMLPVCSSFADVPLPPQRESLSYLGEETRASARSETSREQNQAPAPDHLELILRESLELADEAHKVSLMSPTPNSGKHTPDEQITAVAKPRAKACPLNGAHLTAMRKQAGIWAAS